MIGNSITQRISAWIRRCEAFPDDPKLWEREGIVYKCALDGQGANVLHIINAVVADEHVMRQAVRAAHRRGS